MAFLGSDFSGTGDVSIKVVRLPKAPMIWRVRNTLRPAFIWGLLTNTLAKLFSRITGIPTLTGELAIKTVGKDGSLIDYGVVSRRVITTAFVDFMVDQLQAEDSSWGDFRWHDSGEGSTAEAVGDTDIETTDGESRVSGTQTEGGSANIYETTATITYTTTKTITEHMLFNAPTGGTGMDRSVFTGVPMTNGEGIQFRYRYTANSGT